MGLFGLSPVAGGLQAPVRDGGAVSVSRAVAATSVRNPTAIPGKAAFDQFDRFDQFDKLTAGKAHGRQGSRQAKLRPGKPCPTGNPVALFHTPKLKILFRESFRFSLNLLQSKSLGFIFHRRCRRGGWGKITWCGANRRNPRYERGEVR